jgi:hypothetical protein
MKRAGGSERGSSDTKTLRSGHGGMISLDLIHFRDGEIEQEKIIFRLA